MRGEGVALSWAVCDEESWAQGAGRRQEIDDFFGWLGWHGVGEFEAAVWPVVRIRPVVKAAVGERSTPALVEEQHEQSDLDAL